MVSDSGMRLFSSRVVLSSFRRICAVSTVRSSGELYSAVAWTAWSSCVRYRAVVCTCCCPFSERWNPGRRS